MKPFKTQDMQNLTEIKVDSEALRKLKNLEGQTFEIWQKIHSGERQRYEAAVLMGYPPPHVASESVQNWESWLAYAQQQRAVSRAFLNRATGVIRVLLQRRGVKGIEAESAARTSEQFEEVERWNAIVETIREWLWQARGDERAFSAINSNFGNGRKQGHV